MWGWWRVLCPAIWVLAGTGVAASGAAASAQLPRVSIDTELGAVVIEVDTVRAPVTAGNFLHYVDQGLYTGGRFYRTVRMDNQPGDSVRIEVIQGGINRARAADRRAPVPLERTSATGLRHLSGTVSMARAGPDTASSEFFICLGDQPELDFGGARHADGQGFAAFAQVVEGMAIVRAIQQRPAEAQRLMPVVEIRAIRRGS